VKCPKCKAEISKPLKEWKYWKFEVHAYSCSHCGTHFREFSKDGKHSFTLKLVKGRGFVKV